MPDSMPAPSAVPRIVGLAAAVAGGAAMISSAFLPWFTVTAALPSLPGLPAQERAEVTGLGDVSAPAVGGVDVAAQVPNDGAWAGWVVIVVGAVAIALAAVAATVSPRTVRRCAAAIAAGCGLVGAAVAAYALTALTGGRSVQVQGVSLGLDVAAAAGPFVVIAGAAAIGAGALLLLIARRTGESLAQTAVMPAQPPVVQQPVPPPLPHLAPDARWARPAAPAPSPRSAPSNPVPAPPAQQHDTVAAPVARRRPDPEWDRNWPGMVPPKPGPVTPSQQETQVVKRPPRPVRVSPNPQTTAIPRQNTYDGPTEPL